MDSNVAQDNTFKEKAKDVRGQGQRFSSLRSSSLRGPHPGDGSLLQICIIYHQVCQWKIMKTGQY